MANPPPLARSFYSAYPLSRPPFFSYLLGLTKSPRPVSALANGTKRVTCENSLPTSPESTPKERRRGSTRGTCRSSAQETGSALGGGDNSERSLDTANFRIVIVSCLFVCVRCWTSGFVGFSRFGAVQSLAVSVRTQLTRCRVKLHE